MESTITRSSLFQRHIALPHDHGSWVFLITPLLVGLFAGRHITLSTGFLLVGVFAAFLLRQPLTVMVKVYSGRRPRRELAAAFFWAAVYGFLALLSLIGLVLLGHAYLLWLALPGIPVFAWHLYLVSRRAERRQLGVDLVATGVLSLAAPAAMWTGLGRMDPLGWALWALTWLQAGASLVYAFLRLEQRSMKEAPPLAGRLRMGWRALLYSAFNVVCVSILALVGILPPLTPLPFLLQLGESLYGSLVKPAAGFKPTAIGIRQLIVSSLVTGLLIIAISI